MSDIRETFERGEGILRMVPNFVPVKFGVPGRRLKIYPGDYYKFGTKAGTIMERWLCAVNGARVKNPERPYQGVSFVYNENGEDFTLNDAIQELGSDLIGEKLWETYHTFPVFSKFFDYETPLYFHFHPAKEVAARVGCDAKPECYYFPPQLNDNYGQRASTYFGFNKGVTKEQVRQKIADFEKDDTKILELSCAYNIEPGQGWYVPAGILHAPGSLLTYEPQWCTDLNCVLENVVCGEIFGKKYLEDIIPADVPEEEKVDYILNAIDWDANFEDDFKGKYYRPNVLLKRTQEGLTEKWVCYGNEFITAKEVTVAPRTKVLLKDKAAYGCVIIQGFGKFGSYDAEAVNMMHVGDQTADEYFVSSTRAKEGVMICNNSRTEPMVLLQHFGPDNAIYVDGNK